MEDLIKRYNALLAKKSEMEKTVSVLSGRLEALQEDLDQQLSHMKTTYNVNDIEEAKSLYETKKQNIERVLSACEVTFND